ncbi:MAG TPA: hypothetical protein VJ739_01180, partial [Gemmataceae bacterium]|nr:hypothetical protein [Gemmataceae bacterium]
AVSPGFAGETPPPAGSAAGKTGSLFITVAGNGGNDQIFTNVPLTNDSQGFVLGNVVGGFGNDLLGLVVNLPPALPAVARLTGFRQSQPTLVLAGGPGGNTGIRTTNVRAVGIQSDLVVL